MKEKERLGLQDRTTLARAEACTIVVYHLLRRLTPKERQKLYAASRWDGEQLGPVYTEEVAWICRDVEAARGDLLANDECD